MNGKGWPPTPKVGATKKSFASRLTSQLDKLKPRGRDKGSMGATDRSPSAGWAPNNPGSDLAFRERYAPFVVASPSPSKASPLFSVRHTNSGSKYSPITRPKRTFRNVMPMRAGSGRNHVGGSSASRFHYHHSPIPPAWISAADPVVSTTPTFHPRQHFIHRPHYVDLVDDDFYDGCDCFPPSVGRCRRCGGNGRDRIRRVQSEESVTHATAGDAYEVMRRRRQVEGQLCYYDDDDNANDLEIESPNANTSDDQNEEHDLAYAEADYIYSAMNRRPPLPLALPAPPTRPQPPPQRKSPSRAVFDSLRRSSVGDKKPLTRSSSSVAQRPSSAASKVMSSTLNRTERKSKERSPTSFRGATTGTGTMVSSNSNSSGNNNNNNGVNNGNNNTEMSTLASVVAVSSAAASIKRDEEKNRRFSVDTAVRLEVSDSSVVYVSNDTAAVERKITPPHSTTTTFVAIAEPVGLHRGTTTVRVGGDASDLTHHATTIEVVGMSDASTSKDVTSTSDKESTDDENGAGNDREMSVKLAEQNAERLRRIRETRRKTSPPVTLSRCPTLSGDEDSDYDADCSATESPRKQEKVQRVASSSSQSSQSSSRSKMSPPTVTTAASRGVTIFEEEEEEDNESIKNRVIRRIDTR